MDVFEVAGRLAKQYSLGATDLLVVSGGEPMQQQDALWELLRDQTLFRQVEIETSGHIPLTWTDVDLPYHGVAFNVSPKLRHANVKRPYSIPVLKQYADRFARFKFVVESIQDFVEIEEIVQQAGIPDNNVYIMPLGTERYDLVVRTQEIAEEVIKRQWNLTSRLHILVYGNRRGV